MVELPNNFQTYSLNKEEASQRIRALTVEEKEELELAQKETDDKESRETSASILRTLWKNPENQTEREIVIDIDQEIQLFEKIYKDSLQIQIDRDEILTIWQKNYELIKKEINIYGYDAVVIIPENLPKQEIVNEKIIETMDEGAPDRKVQATHYYIDKNSITTSEGPRYRIILTKSDQNIGATTDPFLKSTLGKNLEDLTGLSAQEVNTKIQQNSQLPINFKINIGGNKIEIKAEGMSEEEYMIFQRAFFEKTGKHLDESGWTWLPKSFSGSRVVNSSWNPATRQLDVNANATSCCDGNLGLRLSRSFS